MWIKMFIYSDNRINVFEVLKKRKQFGEQLLVSKNLKFKKIIKTKLN